MRLGYRLLPAAIFLLAAFPRPAAAQREAYSFVSYAGSDVSLVSSATDEETARINTPILSGDRIVTGASSRAEAVLASGNIVRIDAKSELRFDRMAQTYEAEDERDLLYLLRGAVAIDVREVESQERAFRLDTDDATIVVEGKGQLRIDVGRRGTEVYVTAGQVDVSGRGGQVTLGAGEYAYVRGTDPVGAESYDPPRDRFARFVDERRDRRTSSSATAYVGADYDYESSIANFDDYGSWTYESAYNRWGWRPNVAADWRPYSLGYWRYTPVGLTWVSYEPWGWLPYHYGTWSWDAGTGWFWLPGSVYAPAWVYWSYTPSYVGWCPTGYYGYYPNYYRSTRLWYGTDGGYLRHPYLRGRVDVTRVDPRGWSYVPSRRLGVRLDPARDILRGDRVPMRPGQTAVVATAPLRIDRGSLSAPLAIQNAVRRITTEPAGGRGGPSRVDEGLTTILRRDPHLTPAAERELRGSILSSGRPETLRPVAPDQILAPRSREEAFVRPGNSGSGAGRRSSGESWRTTAAPARQADAGSRVEPRRRDDGWRSPASPAPRNLSPRPADRSRQSDTGWRAPRAVPKENAGAPPVRRNEGDWREAPRRGSPAPRMEAPAPRKEAPAPRNEAPVRRSEGAWREAPRRERIEAPAPRREAVAPRREAAVRPYEPPVRSYEPNRSHEPARRAPAPHAPPAAAPRYAPAPVPQFRSAPAPAPRVAPAAPRGGQPRR
jgi:hypothetical protein